MNNRAYTKQSQWYALYVKPRHEKAIASALRGKGYEQLVPLYSPPGSRGRSLPLFPSYVFACFDPQDRLPILSVPGVFFIVGVGKNPVPIDNAELEAVQTVIASGCAAEPHKHIASGDRVRITEGPLRGVEGFLERDERNCGFLIVSLTLLQRSISVKLDPEWVVRTTGEARSAAPGSGIVFAGWQ